jgi:Cu(I)/Ag(I) efflux system membrane fusion protein
MLIAVALAACGSGCDRGRAPNGEHAAHESAEQTAPASASDEAHTNHQGGSQLEAGAGQRAEHAGVPQGLETVLLDPARRQALGVRVARVEQRSFERDVRVSGIVRIDETKQSHVHLKFDGFVEKVFVNFVGRRVKRGEPLLSIYSPDLLAAEAEYAQALTAREQVKPGEFAAMERAQAEALVQAARSRLQLLDVPAEELARLERTKQASRTLTIRSPLTGTVLQRDVVDGMRVMPEMTLLVIADLSNVWIVGDVFESDLASVKLGDRARIQFAGGAAPDREGRLTFIAPTLDETTRSAQVRVEAPNPDGVLRPGLFADMLVHVAGGRGLAVPDGAVIDTGIRKLAFVERSAGRFEPRELQIGSRAGGFVEVLSGVSEGEQVVVSAQFLLDAESQIRGSSPAGGHGGH